MKTLLPAAAALLLVSQVHAKPFADFTADEQTRLRAGEILTWGDKAEKKRFVHSAVLLDHPVDQVWALLDDKESSPTYIPSVRSARLISREANVCVIAQETEAPGTGQTFRYVMQHTSSYPERVDFVRLSGDLRRIEGAWIFETVDEGTKTLLLYVLHMDAGFLVPQSFVVGSQMRTVPGIMTSIRQTLATQVWPPVPLTAGMPSDPVSPAVVP